MYVFFSSSVPSVILYAVVVFKLKKKPTVWQKFQEGLPVLLVSFWGSNFTWGKYLGAQTPDKNRSSEKILTFQKLLIFRGGFCALCLKQGW